MIERSRVRIPAGTCCVIYRVFSESLWQRKAGKCSELGKKVGNERFEERVF